MVNVHLSTLYSTGLKNSNAWVSILHSVEEETSVVGKTVSPKSFRSLLRRMGGCIGLSGPSAGVLLRHRVSRSSSAAWRSRTPQGSLLSRNRELPQSSLESELVLPPPKEAVDLVLKTPGKFRLRRFSQWWLRGQPQAGSNLIELAKRLSSVLL